TRASIPRARREGVSSVLDPGPGRETRRDRGGLPSRARAARRGPARAVESARRGPAARAPAAARLAAGVQAVLHVARAVAHGARLPGGPPAQRRRARGPRR